MVDFCELKGDIRKKALDVIDSYANRGLRALGICRQVKKRLKYSCFLVLFAVLIMFFLN